MVKDEGQRIKDKVTHEHSAEGKLSEYQKNRV